MEFKKLFSPVKIGSLSLKNRIVMPAMGTGMASFDGTPSDQLTAYYRKRAESGTGLIITEITRVNDLHGATMPRQLSMSHDRYINPFSEFVNTIHEAGAKIFCQLHHPGRQNLSVMVLFWPSLLFLGRLFPSFWKIFPKMVPFVLNFMEKIWAPRVVAPSAIPCTYSKQRTRALRTGEVEKLVLDFAKAAERVWKSGADGVEIHASHGYLIQQFLSPRTNKRTDRYGGSREKRLTFLLEIIREVRKKCGPEFPISVRLTIDEYYGEEEGIQLDDGLYYARKLEEAGIDMLNVSSGTYETMDSWLEPISYEPGWRKNLAGAVKEVVSIPVLGASFIRTPQQAEVQLEEGVQDLVALGRGQIADPDWTEKALNGKPELIRRCISCLNCFESLNRNAALGFPLQCTVNYDLGREFINIFPEEIENNEKALVIGAGPAGLSSALILSEHGFTVEVWEKDSSAGGQLKLAEIPPFKDKISWFYEDLLSNLRNRKVSVHFNKQADIVSLKSYNPDLIVLASGGKPLKPAIKGIENSNVYLYSEVLRGEVSIPEGRVLIVGSGMSGLETAEFLSDMKRDITVVEMKSSIGEGIYKQNKDDVLKRLEERAVSFLTNRKLMEIKKTSIKIENLITEKNEEISYDALILALGVKPENELREILEKNFSRVITVGDASKPGRIFDAAFSSYSSLSSRLHF